MNYAQILWESTRIKFGRLPKIKKKSFGWLVHMIG